jgi:hypothetical protein
LPHAARPRFAQQEQIYDAIYHEASAVNRLLEEAELSLAASDAAVIAYEVRRFLVDGAWAHQEDTPPAEVLAAEIAADDDAGASAVRVRTQQVSRSPSDTAFHTRMHAVENIMRYVLGCTPAGGLDMNDTAHALRDAVVTRLVAAQCKIPGVQFFVCRVLGAMVLLTFPLMHVGVSEDAVQSDAEALLFATLTSIIVLFLCITDDLADPNNGLYSVTPVRATLQAALLDKVDGMLEQADAA